MEVKNNKKSYDLHIPTVSGEFQLDDSQSGKTNRGCFLGQRHVVTVVGFFCCFFMTGSRLTLSVGIVAMVKHRQTKEAMRSNESEISCPFLSTPQKNLIESNFQGEFDWSTELQGYLLGIGYLSFLITQTPAGRLADAIGSKSLLVISNAVSGLLTIICPFVARWHVYALMAVQFLRGASQGFTLPATYKMLSNWIPKHERGTLSTLVVSGYSVGIAACGMVTGWLCDIPGFGWPSAFYILGATNVLLGVVIQFICYEYPENHPWIKQEELKYITNGLETKETKKNGVTSCLPVLMKSVGGLTASVICYWITKKNLIGLNKLRKLTTGVGALGFSLCMAVILLAGCDAITNILCFALSLFSTGLALSGVMIAGVDMAPVFAGSLMGVASTIAGWASVLIPVITGWLTSLETLSEWRIVFWINLGVVGSSGLLYVLFGSAEVQSWNYPVEEYRSEATTKERMHSDKRGDKQTDK